MIDAAGAIYVIGGATGVTYFNDVLVSTDGGGRPDSVGRGRGVHQLGTKGVLGCTMGTTGVPQGTQGARGGYSGETMW